MKTIDFGDLRVGMTTTLDWVWDDSRTGSTSDGCIYNPKPEGGLLPLGSIGFGSHHDVKPRSGTWGVLLVGNVPGKEEACKHPTGYTEMWNDKGSGGKFDVSIWRPIAPPGYVALGEYCVNRYAKPSTDDVWCIRQDYVADGKFTYAWWDDRGSGANLNVGCWEVTPMNISIGGNDYIPIRTDTFYAKGGTHTTPPPSSLAKTLQLYVGRDYRDFSTPLPRFTIDKLPFKSQIFSEQEQASVKLPYTSFFHASDQRSVDKIADPFISLSRSCCWHVAGVWENGNAAPWSRKETITYGFSKEQSRSLTESAGVSITTESGVSAGPVSAGVSMTLNYQLTSSSSSSVSEFSSKTVEETVTVPAMTATVLFTRRMFYKSVRSDGTEAIAKVAIDATDDVHFGHCKIPAS